MWYEAAVEAKRAAVVIRRECEAHVVHHDVENKRAYVCCVK